MDDVPILGCDDPQNIIKEFTAQYDAPAYVRRARHVQQTYDGLLDRCHRQRNEWLDMVRTRLGLLHALAGDWAALEPLVRDAGQIDLLRRLHSELEPRLRSRIERTTSVRALRRALGALMESIERFNRRWRAFLPGVDLTEVNRLRDNYNHYFLLEKECAVRSYRLASLGFQKLQPLTVEDLFAALPELAVPLVG